jgi:hypothetical protein
MTDTLRLWKDVERKLKEIGERIDDIDSVTDPATKLRYIRWAQDACEDLASLLGELIPDGN